MQDSVRKTRTALGSSRGTIRYGGGGGGGVTAFTNRLETENTFRCNDQDQQQKLMALNQLMTADQTRLQDQAPSGPQHGVGGARKKPLPL